MSKAWFRRRQKDQYHQLAKKRGYRSRAAYKLKQLDKKLKLFKKAKTVVDLGAAPGGWLQVESEMVGNEGFVIGIDKRIIEPLEQSNIKIIQGDITEESIITSIKQVLEEKLILEVHVDVVTSDVSPNVSGIWELDHARQIALARASLRIIEEILKTGGNAVIKVFQGIMFNEFVDDTKALFHRIKIMKPSASRRKSAEIYVIGLKRK